MTQDLNNGRVHGHQTVVPTSQCYVDGLPSGLYCVDARAHLRWRVGRHRLFPDKVFLAPVPSQGEYVRGMGMVQLGRSTIVVRWP